MNRIIMNSRGDQGVVRSQVIGFQVSEAVESAIEHFKEPAILTIHLIGFKGKVVFEVAQTNDEMKVLVERFRKLFEGDIQAALKERMKFWLSRWHCVPVNLDEAVEDIIAHINVLQRG